MAESCGEEGSSLLFRRGAVVVGQGWFVFALLLGMGVLQLPCLLSRCFHCAISCQIMFGGKLIAVLTMYKYLGRKPIREVPVADLMLPLKTV